MDMPKLIAESVIKLKGMKRARNPKKLPMLTVANAGSPKGLMKSINEKGLGLGGNRERTLIVAKLRRPRMRKALTRIVQGNPI
jgi:hypothetical protein